MKKKYTPILCLDFDGVLNNYDSGWQGPRTISDQPVPGAMKWLARMVAGGRFEIHIFSSRSRYVGGRWAMKRWLRKSLLACSEGYSRVDVEDVLSMIRWPKYKPPAMVSIDDRALTFTGTFPGAYELLRFKPWNKR
jgi:trehalose-6-phosphatase